MSQALLMAAALSLPISGLAAQQPRRLTNDAINSAIEIYNRDGTVRTIGDTPVSAGNDVTGHLAVLEGTLRLAAAVQGDVLVINGDLELQPGGSVAGRAIVIGGSFMGDPATVRAGVEVYSRSFDYVVEQGTLRHLPRRPSSELAAGRAFDFGRMDVIATARPGYNRVEGLPILIGPRLTLGHANPTILEGLITYRTAAGFQPEDGDVGYSLRTEQFLGGLQALRVGARAYSEIAIIEDSGVSDREASLAAFVLHRDYRDHYERQGIAGYVRLDPPRRDFSLRIEYADERHYRVRARRPWSLIDNEQGWRPEPLAATGYLRRITGAIAYDTRNLPEDPAHGWWIRADAERGLGGNLRDRFDGFDQAAPRRYLHGTLDLRRYARLGPSSRLALRVLATGSIDGDALPVQRQHALGGEGSLPGFALHRFRCGADDQIAVADQASFQRFYGCDRAALLQLDYQTDLRFLRQLRGTRLDRLVFQRLRLAAFIDAGRAWTEADARGVRASGNDDFSADVGVGVRLGPLGAYWAVPLSGSGGVMNFFLRIGPRL